MKKPLLSGDSTVYKTVFTYNSNHCITQITTPRGKNWTMGYFADNSTQWVKDPCNNETDFQYTTTDKTVTDPNGRVTTFTYSSGRVTRITDPLTYYVEYTWDTGKNCVTNIRDKRAYNWAYTYDSSGNVLTATDPYSNVTTNTWNSKNRMTQTTNDLGNKVVYTYATNNVDCTKIEYKQSNNTLVNQTQFTYTSAGLMDTITDGLSHTTTMAYDTDGNLDSVTNALSKTTSFVQDTLGRVTKVTDALSHETNVEYDNWGRQKTATPPNIVVGQPDATGYIYDADDNLTKVTDALGHTVEYAFDDAARLTQVKKLRATSTYDIINYAYDGTGQKGLLSTKTDGNGRVTTYSYTYRNELSSATYPVSSGVNTSESWTYNANGDMATHVDAKSQTLSYAYDNASRLITIDYPSGTDTSFTYDDANRLTQMTDSTGTTGYTYDEADRLTQTASPNGTVSYTFDNASRRSTMVISGSPSQTYTYGYDNADRLTSLQNPFSETTSWTYDDADRLTKQTFANGSYLDYEYDVRDQVTKIISKKSDNSYQWEHAYLNDAAGNVVERTDYQGDESDPFNKTTFAYDYANQLTSESCQTNALQTVYSRTYAYDYNGNRTSKVFKDASTGYTNVTTSYAYDWQDRLTSATTSGVAKTYTYDNNGNCTQIAVGGTTTATLSYDYENRVTSIAQTGVTTNTFTYNGFNLRAGKVDSGGTFIYLTDGSEPGCDVLKDSKATYTPGISESRTVGMSAVSKFYHTDGIGSTRGVTDSTQAITDTALFDAFGNVVTRTGSTPTPFGFAGDYQYQSDGDTTLQLLGNRYYDPSIGRFLSKDPIKAGDNWFAYCENNSLKWVDPEGLDAKGNNQGLPKERIGIDPKQRADLEEELKRLKEAGSKPGDRGRINEIKEKLKGDDKYRGNKGSRHGNRGRPAPPVVEPIVVAEGALVLTGVYVTYRIIRLLPSLAPPLWWTLVPNLATP